MKDPQAPYYCLVPDVNLRDEFFHCAIDSHHCIPIQPNDPFPHCNNTIIGDTNLDEERLFSGLWYKPYAWKLGEPIEFSPCNTIDLTVSPRGQLTMVTNWTAKDGKG